MTAATRNHDKNLAGKTVSDFARAFFITEFGRFLCLSLK